MGKQKLKKSIEWALNEQKKRYTCQRLFGSVCMYVISIKACSPSYFMTVMFVLDWKSSTYNIIVALLLYRDEHEENINKQVRNPGKKTRMENTQFCTYKIILRQASQPVIQPVSQSGYKYNLIFEV